MGTKNIGEITGKTLIFGGVYSNLQALEKLIKISEKLKIAASNIICTGDVVGYCAQPEACVQQVKNWDINVIAGNVELQLGAGKNDCGCNFKTGSRCNAFSESWYPFAQKSLSPDSISWMRELPNFIRFKYAGKKVFVLHGSFQNTSEYIFKSTPEGIFKTNFNDTQSNLILAGHSGLPFYRNIQKNTWINAGVIGMPANDGTPRVWYVIMDDHNGIFTFEHHSFEYDYHLAIAKMQQQPLPAEYALTLASGHWDNCEILPKEETKTKGIPIVIDTGTKGIQS